MSRIPTLPLVLLALGLPALAQEAPPPQRASADVVVTATAAPESLVDLGAAASVLDADELARSRESALPEVLRRLPGLDVVQAGGPGAVTSLFLRGSNSNQALVLVDGVPVNSPFFGGVDLSTLSLANVGRVEVVRGPFSSLWGSEAVGGVVQVFTRRAEAGGLSGSGSFAAGNADGREGMVNAAYSEGPVSVTAGFRRVQEDGEQPNEFFAATNLSTAVEASLGDAVRAGLTLRHDEGRTGIPRTGDTPTPFRTTTADTTALSLPVHVTLGAATNLELTGLWATDHPTYSDPQDPYGYTFDDTKSERAGARLVATHRWGAQRISVGAEWQRAVVTDEDAYGVELDHERVTTRSLFAEDRVALAGDALVATLGVRYDGHSAFGGATSPRATLAWHAFDGVKLRVAAGGAFRAPTIGELYYPFSGNAALRPERSASFEAGADVTLAPRATLSVTAFRNEVRDLIQYDFATYTNVNVGRARMTGVEVELVAELGGGVFGRAGYTWLDAWDEATGLALLRRPEHRASATLGVTAWGGSVVEVTGLFTGTRDDVDAATFARVTDPSWFRVDAAVTGPRVFGRFTPFLRVANLFDRRYEQAAGFPAAGRRVLAGVQASF